MTVIVNTVAIGEVGTAEWEMFWANDPNKACNPTHANPTSVGAPVDIGKMSDADDGWEQVIAKGGYKMTDTVIIKPVGPLDPLPPPDHAGWLYYPSVMDPIPRWHMPGGRPHSIRGQPPSIVKKKKMIDLVLETGPHQYKIRGKGWGYIAPRAGTLGREKRKVVCRKLLKYQTIIPTEQSFPIIGSTPPKSLCRGEENFNLRRAAGCPITGGYKPGPKSFRNRPKFGNVSKRVERRVAIRVVDSISPRKPDCDNSRPYKKIWNCPGPSDPTRKPKEMRSANKKGPDRDGNPTVISEDNISVQPCLTGMSEHNQGPDNDGNPTVRSGIITSEQPCISSILKKPGAVSTHKKVWFEMAVYKQAIVLNNWRRWTTRVLNRPLCMCTQGCNYPCEYNRYYCVYCLPEDRDPDIGCSCPCTGCDSDSDDGSIAELVAGGTEPDTDRLAVDQLRSHIVLTAPQVMRIASSRAQARLIKRARIEASNPATASPEKRRRIANKRMDALERRRRRRGCPLTLSICYEHPRDHRIEFDEENHIYTLDGDLQFPISVSGVWARFFPKFDMIETVHKYFGSWSLNCESKYYDTIASSREVGMPDDEIMQAIVGMWKENGRTASQKGTYMHRQIELFLNGCESDESLPEMDQFKQFMHDVVVTEDWTPYRTEWSIFDDHRMIAGQVDCIFKESSGSVYHMVDWKRCGKPICRRSNHNFDKHGYPPCEFLEDNSWSHYALQQNIYGVILKQHYNIELKSMHLLQLHENQSTYQYIEIPDLMDIAEQMMDICVSDRVEPIHPQYKAPVQRPLDFTNQSRTYNELFLRLTLSAKSVTSRRIPKILNGNRNCIPSGLANLTGRWNRIADLLTNGKLQSNVNKSYFKCAYHCGVTLRRRDTVDFELRGKFLIHLELEGMKHCIAVDTMDGSSVIVANAGRSWNMGLSNIISILTDFADLQSTPNFEIINDSLSVDASSPIDRPMDDVDQSGELSAGTIHPASLTTTVDPSISSEITMNEHDTETATPHVTTASAPIHRACDISNRRIRRWLGVCRQNACESAKFSSQQNQRRSNIKPDLNVRWNHIKRRPRTGIRERQNRNNNGISRCLPMACETFGYDCRQWGNGPWCVYPHGQAMLRPYHKVMQAWTSSSLTKGEYVIWYENHFEPLTVNRRGIYRPSSPWPKDKYSSLKNLMSVIRREVCLDSLLCILYKIVPINEWDRNDEWNSRGGMHCTMDSSDSLTSTVDLYEDDDPRDIVMSDYLIGVTGCNPPAFPPLRSETKHYVEVPRDGMCFYYLPAAARDPVSWISEHGTDGLGINDDIQSRDTKDAENVKRRIIEIGIADNDPRIALRLNYPGKKGYPTDKEFPYLAKLMMGQLVVYNEEDASQTAYGSGPLRAYIVKTETKDGANHPSDHYQLIQSWCGCMPDDKEPIDIDSEDITDQSIMTPATVLKRLKFTGASTSDADFDARFDDTTALDDFIRKLNPEPERKRTTILSQLKEAAEYVDGKQPTWPPRLKHLAVGALTLYRVRLSDIYVREYALLFHMTLGDRLVRSHNHRLFVWNDDIGYFARFSGILPEVVYVELKDYLLQLEGLFRSFTGSIARENESIIAEITRAYQSEESELPRALCHWKDCAILHQSNRNSADDRTDNNERPRHPQASIQNDADSPALEPVRVPGEQWYTHQAKCISSISQKLQCKVMGKEVWQYYTEWCNVPKNAISGVAYKDYVFQYDVSDVSDPAKPILKPMTQLRQADRKRIYVGIPFKLMEYRLGDPVFMLAIKKCKTFYKQTFWANVKAYDCTQAGHALCKRHENIDEMFFMLGPGGVGLTLTTEHLSAMLGPDNHKALDPQMFYLDEELRKQIELICDAIAWTACEKPEGMTKAFREDLFKKVQSADGLFGRLPYQIVTRVIHMIGWKRMELNRLIRFGSISEQAFHSIFRRCLLIRVNARFVDPQWINEHMPDASKYGIFPRDPDMKDFLTSRPGIAAGLYLQNQFELKHNKLDCRKIISDYRLHGGDDGVTLKLMREACGLPPVQQESTGCEGTMPSGINVLDSQEGPNVYADEITDITINYMLDNNLDTITRTYFNNVTLTPEQTKRDTRDTYWSRMKSSDRWSTAMIHKSKDAIFPKINTINSYKNFVQEAPGVITTLPENHNMAELQAYCNGYPHRAENIDALVDALNNCSATRRKCGAAKRDRTSVLRHQGLTITQAEKMMKDHISRATHEHAGDSEPSPKKSRQSKNSRTKTPLEQKVLPTSYKLTVGYAYDDITPSRAYATKEAAQGMPKRLQYTALDNTVDLDIKCGCFTIINQIIEKMVLRDPAVFHLELQLLKRLGTERDTVITEDLKMKPTIGKDTLMTNINGRTPDNTEESNPVIKLVRRLGRMLRWTACSCLPDVYESKSKKDLRWAMHSTFDIWWQRIEDMIIRFWLLHIQKLSATHISIHFGGVRINRERITAFNSSIEEFCAESSAVIGQDSGFVVQIKEKRHECFMTIITQNSPPTDSPLPEDAQLLLTDGNCIPLALYRMGRKTIATAVRENSQNNTSAKESGSRSYRQCQDAYTISLTPYVGVDLDVVGNYIIHMEIKGKPHCVACIVEDGDGNCRIYDRSYVYRTTVDSVRDYALAAIDRTLIVTFRVNIDGASYPLNYPDDSGVQTLDGLLDLRAGAGDMYTHDYEYADTLMSDESEIYIHAALKSQLEQEVSKYLESIPAAKPNKKHRRVMNCELCPFRAFNCGKDLRKHCECEHLAESNFVASGTKQVKVLMALYDNMQISQNTNANIIRRSAEIMRNSIKPDLSNWVTNIDRAIVLVFDTDGPVFLHENTVAHSSIYRRVGSTYYSRGFATMLIQETLLNHGRVKPMVYRLALIFSQRGSLLTSLLMGHVAQWLQILEDVLYSPFASAIYDDLLRESYQNQEFKHITMDATIRIMRRVKGQEDYRSSTIKRNRAPIPDCDAKRRILTILGRTGCVIGLPLISTEGSPHVSKALLDVMSSEHRNQVQSCSTDNCSRELYLLLQSILPNLKYLMLDTVHPAIVYEHCFYKKKTPGSRLLRKIMHKFNKVEPTLRGEFWGPVFDGNETVAPTVANMNARAHIIRLDMPRTQCKKIINDLDGEVPWLTTIDFINAIAALCSTYPKEVKRKSHCNGTQLKRVLYNLTSATKMQWYFNNIRYRHDIPQSEISLLGSGTAPNEALHAEINRVSRNQPEWYSTTAELQMRTTAFAKNMSHNCAAYHPTLRQINPSLLLHRRVAGVEIDPTTWTNYCKQLNTTGSNTLLKATIPMFRNRQRIHNRIKNHNLNRRPAAATKVTKPVIKKKRTVFTLKRRPAASHTQHR